MRFSGRGHSPTEIPGCRVCGGSTTAIFRTTDLNRNITDESFSYARCNACGVIILVNPPDDIRPYYGGDYFNEPTRGDLEYTARREAYQLGFVTRYVDAGHLIEIGAAWGTFALNAVEHGFDVAVLEADEHCCAFLERELDIQVIQTSTPEAVLSSLPSSSAIVLWQTLEHLPDPHAFVTAAAANLEPYGVLVIATPNPESFGFRVLGRKWPHVDAPRHLWLLPIDHLEHWSASVGLELIEVTTSDKGARRWNAFAWQRYFLNGAKWPVLKAGAFILGWITTFVLIPIERRHRRGSSYTAVFRKTSS